MTLSTETPVLGFAAFSGTGKTTLLKYIIPLLRAEGLRLGLIKHSHHLFDIDKPGKDSHTLSEAGAAQILIASARRTVLVIKHPADDKPDLHQFLGRLDGNGLDMILVEGFKNSPIPKLELHRPRLGHPLLCRDDPAVIAVASDGLLSAEVTVPVLDLNNPRAIADFIQNRFLEASHCNAQDIYGS